MSIINELTREEILMIEMLTYLDEDVANAAKDGKNETKVKFYKINEEHKNRTIGEILETFDDGAIANLQSHSENICGADLNGQEWADIIRYIKNSESLSNLTLVDMYIDENPYHLATDEHGREYPYQLGLCFTDGENAIIAFKGTTGPNEWYDSAYAAIAEETAPQRSALSFVEKISEKYSDITVTGHSKGANKAMYSAIRCKNVSRCVCFDGEGFSDKFLKKYEAEIAERASLVTNISLSSDFIHIMLNQLPGSKQLYVKGYGVDGMAENHAPNSFFKQNLYKSRKYPLNDELLAFESLTEHIPVFDYEPERGELTKLHDLIQYIISHGRESERIVSLAAKLLPVLVLGMDKHGNEASDKYIANVILNNEASLVRLLGRILCFVAENGLGVSYINDLLEAFNVSGLAPFRSFFIAIAIKCLTESKYDADPLMRAAAWMKTGNVLEKYISKSKYEELWERIQREYLGLRFDTVKWHDDELFIKEVNALYQFANSDFVKSLDVEWDSSSIRQVKDKKDLYCLIEDAANKSVILEKCCHARIKAPYNIITQDAKYFELRYMVYDDYLTQIKEMLAVKGYTLQLGSDEEHDIFVTKDNAVVYIESIKDIIDSGEEENTLCSESDGDTCIFGKKMRGNSAICGV